MNVLKKKDCYLLSDVRRNLTPHPQKVLNNLKTRKRSIRNRMEGDRQKT